MIPELGGPSPAGVAFDAFHAAWSSALGTPEVPAPPVLGPEQEAALAAGRSVSQVVGDAHWYTTELAVAPETLWKRLHDPLSWPRTLPALHTVAVVSQAGPGTFLVVGVEPPSAVVLPGLAPPADVPLRMQVRAASAPRTTVWYGRMDHGLIAASGVWAIEPVPGHPERSRMRCGLAPQWYDVAVPLVAPWEATFCAPAPR